MAASPDDFPGTLPLADAPSERSTAPKELALPVDTRLLHPGTLVGRFVVERILGSGGMGVVYLASDPELGRKVALKLLRGASGGEGARARLLREAQAMARLQHPNVVVVYETGTFRDEVFVAMEHIEGTLLAKWLTARRRPWHEVLAVFVQAGRGLAAAHAAGLIHRDFKPANVLLDGEGRARVLDFGLARARDDDESLDVATPPALAITPMSGSLLTRPGDILGTPAYMAPEQRAGGRASAQSDLYSFCVSLHEGLFGERPEDTPPARLKDVPARVRRVVARGLARSPSLRPASMAALLGELEAAARPRHGPLVAAASVVLLGGGVATAALLGGERVDPCARAERRLVGIWDDARRAQLRTGFMAVGAPYATRAWESTEKLLDRYAAAWVDAAETTCRAPDPPELRAAHASCLDQRLQSLAGVVNVLAAPDARSAAHAPEAASGLDDLRACTSAQGGAEPVPADPGMRQRVQLLRARISAAFATARMGLYNNSAVELSQVRDAALGLGYRPLEAEALSTLAYVHFQSDEHKQAEEELYRALEAAEESHDDFLRGRIWRQLSYVYGGQTRWADGHRATTLARAILRGTGPVGEWELATLDVNEAYNLAGEKRNEEALVTARRGLATAERLRPPDDPRLASFLNAVGYALNELKRPDEAEPYFRRVLDLYLAINGEVSAPVAKMLNNLGSAAYVRGDPAKALELYLRALKIKEQLLTPDNLGIGYGTLNVGEALHKLGRHAEAIPYFERARDILTARLGPDAELVASTWQGLGECQLDGGQPAAAIAALERALTLRQAAKPLVSADLGKTRFALARALWDGGADPRRARALAVQAEIDLAAEPEHAAVMAWLGAHVTRR